MTQHLKDQIILGVVYLTLMIGFFIAGRMTVPAPEPVNRVLDSLSNNLRIVTTQRDNALRLVKVYKATAGQYYIVAADAQVGKLKNVIEYENSSRAIDRMVYTELDSALWARYFKTHQIGGLTKNP